jgi:hypothetical protein
MMPSGKLDVAEHGGRSFGLDKEFASLVSTETPFASEPSLESLITPILHCTPLQLSMTI